MYNFVFIASLLKTPYKFYIIQPYGRYCVNSQHNISIKLYALLTTFFCLTLHGKLFSASIISVYAGSSVLYIYAKEEYKQIKKFSTFLSLEERGFEPRASRMRSERSTPELHPPYNSINNQN